MPIKGERFYKSEEGEVNARIMGMSTPRLDGELIKKYADDACESVLIMGYGDGRTVDYFLGRFPRIHVVEGSEELVRRNTDKHANLAGFEFHNSYFEKFRLPARDRVDIILGNHVLEHVDNPIEVLLRTKAWLKESGRAIFTVPNGDSLHRRIGVQMGLLGCRFDLHNKDIEQGHQRVYDKESFLSIFDSSGYKILEFGGYNIKVVSQKQMEDWPDYLLGAIYSVSRTCPPEICSNIYVVCEK